MDEQREAWGLPVSQSVDHFFEFLIRQIGLIELELPFPKRTEVRLCRPTFNPYELAQSFRRDGYLSHRSALELHGLTEMDLTKFDKPAPSDDTINRNEANDASGAGTSNAGRVTYLPHGCDEDCFFTVDLSKRDVVNNPDGVKNPLPQEKIDAAFAKPQRVTNQYAHWQTEHRQGYLFLLNQTNRDQAGVIRIPRPPVSILEPDSAKQGAKPYEPVSEVTLRVTSLERTLLDCTVRPSYSGGATAVLAAYKQAARDGRIDLSHLLSLLLQFDYTYPYQQAVGFYLQRAGLDRAALAPYRKRISQLDFYLEAGYSPEELDYDPTWRLFYPKEIGL